MITLGEFSNAQILPFIGKGFPKKTFYTDEGPVKVNMSSNRLECLRRSQECAFCHKQGNIWLLQKSITNPPRVRTSCFIDECPWCSLRADQNWTSKWSAPHLNLFYRDMQDRMTMLTFDHIIPKARGGADTVENGQTLCIKCNQKKGCELIPAGTESPFPIHNATKDSS
jgi:5-methylcytosine-specific restriction endonuclease McrA